MEDVGYIKWWDAQQNLYKKAILERPFDGFYTDTRTRTAVFRIVGLVETFDGRVGYILMRPPLTRIIGGVPAWALTRVFEWDEEQLNMINSSDNPQLFLEPRGWFEYRTK